MIAGYKGLGILSATTMAVALAGCSSDDQPFTGQLSLAVSDGPVHNATEVCLEFNEIEIKKAGSAAETMTDLTLQQINLLSFQGMNSAPLFIDVEVEAGEYDWIRLGVNAVKNGNGGQGDPLEDSVGCSYGGSYVLFEDEPDVPYNAYVPSGAQTGLKINSKFVVAQGGATSMTAEFDLQKTLTEPPGLDGDIIVRPSIRLVNDLEVGAVTGMVADDLIAPAIDVSGESAACEPAAFVFADGTGPGSMDMLESIASAMVKNDADPTVYEYTVGYLQPGEYDLAFSCDAENFDPGVGDVTIVAGQTAVLDFPVPVEEPAE
jgi:hypothetical protein